MEVIDNDTEKILQNKQTLPRNSISKAEKIITMNFQSKMII